MLWLLLSTEGPAGRGGRLSSPVSRRARLRRPWAEPEPLAHGAPPRSGPVPTPFTGDACAAHMATTWPPRSQCRASRKARRFLQYRLRCALSTLAEVNALQEASVLSLAPWPGSACS